MIGRVVDGAEVLTHLGSGRITDSYMAVDTRASRYLALKVLKKEIAAHPQASRAFLNAASRMTNLSTPNIVAVQWTGVSGEEGQPYIATDYIEGLTLLSALTSPRMLTMEDARSILSQCSKALDDCHSRNLFHGALGPSNIYIVPKAEGMEALIDDFGLMAAATQAMGHAPKAFLWPSLLDPASPEQRANPGQASARSDQYSLGIIAVLLLSRALQNGGPLDDEKLEQAIRNPSGFLSELAKHLNPSAILALQKALSDHPKGRFPTCGEFVNTVFSAQSVAAPPIVIEEVEAAEPLMNQGPKRTSSPLPGLVLAVICVLAFGLIWGASLLNKPPASTPIKREEEQEKPPTPQVVTVPNLIGLTLSQVEAELAQRKLRVRSQYEHDSGWVGTVIRQSPRYGLQVQEGQEVEVVISRGLEPSAAREEQSSQELAPPSAPAPSNLVRGPLDLCSVELPPGWSYKEERSGEGSTGHIYVKDGAVLAIWVTPGAAGSIGDTVTSMEQRLEGSSRINYARIDMREYSLAGIDGVMWTYLRTDEGVRQKNENLYIQPSWGHFAFRTAAPDTRYDQFQSEFDRVRESLRIKE